MKEVAQTSPDAYIQMALQLTWWRLYKKPTPVYESASTRLFRGGRTETGRSTSEESIAFCKSFDNDDVLVRFDSIVIILTDIQPSFPFCSMMKRGGCLERLLQRKEDICETQRWEWESIDTCLDCDA